MIQRFTNLLGLEVYNSTIVEWNQDAAITGKHNPLLTFIALIRVRMEELPEGILLDFPHSVVDIEISESTLSSLPSDLHLKWPRVRDIFIENSRLTEVPESFSQMSELIGLSCINNSIATLPEQLFVSTERLEFAALGWNPIQKLPDSIKPVGLAALGLDHTGISDLPPWTKSKQVMSNLQFLSAGGTPFCTKWMNQSSSAEDELLSGVLQCEEDQEQLKLKLTPGLYPLDFISTRRVP